MCWTEASWCRTAELWPECLSLHLLRVQFCRICRAALLTSDPWQCGGGGGGEGANGQTAAEPAPPSAGCVQLNDISNSVRLPWIYCGSGLWIVDRSEKQEAGNLANQSCTTGASAALRSNLIRLRPLLTVCVCVWGGLSGVTDATKVCTTWGQKQWRRPPHHQTPVTDSSYLAALLGLVVFFEKNW